MRWKQRIILFCVIALAIFTILSIRYFLLPHCEKDYLGTMPCPQPSWMEVQQQYKETTFKYIQIAVVFSLIITLIIDVTKFIISKKIKNN